MPGNYISTPEFRRLIEAANSVRRRGHWNDRLEHWERPASVSEEGTIARAESNVKSALYGDPWFSLQGVSVEQQGSYFNNTNVRTEADIDIRVVHPNIHILYADGIEPTAAWNSLGYRPVTVSNEFVSHEMRRRIRSRLESKFEAKNVNPGCKAIKVSGITGSRADVDVVPVLRLNFVRHSATPGYIEAVEGVALFSTSGEVILNFPDQHYSNGVTKRSNTQLRFKKVVRCLKRMRSDMADAHPIANHIPSFLIECLVYLVEDDYFCVAEDDRFTRLKRVLGRLSAILWDPSAEASLLEINDVKRLFGVHQPWQLWEARSFVGAAQAWMGD